MQVGATRYKVAVARAEIDFEAETYVNSVANAPLVLSAALIPNKGNRFSWL
ncbi:hypothetical protein [Chitinophaga silvisoli]|uniref:hypothetical protein n=1 Tax=Chitinophaga silvisoli TaxID=2291814 RepID=UPI001314A135|nr:hypothetical protein [Chitinophaga silvisoli]